MLRFMAPSMDMAVYVSGIPAMRTKVHAGSCSSPHQMWTLTTPEREKLSQQKVCADTIVTLTFSQHVLVAKRARKDTIQAGAAIRTDVATEARDRFSSLKALLGTVPAVCANREVRLRSPYSKSFFDEPIRRKPSPSETMSKTYSHV